MLKLSGHDARAARKIGARARGCAFSAALLFACCLLTGCSDDEPIVCPCSPPAAEVVYRNLDTGEAEQLSVTITEVGAKAPAQSGAELNALRWLAPGHYDLIFSFEGSELGMLEDVCFPPGGCGCGDYGPTIAVEKTGTQLRVTLDRDGDCR